MAALVAAAAVTLPLATALTECSAQTANLPELEARAIRAFDERRYGEAERDLRTILSQKPDDRTANILLSFAFARQGQFELALEQTRQALNRFPHSLKLHVLLVGLLARERDTIEQARAIYEQVLLREPDNRLAQLGLAETDLTRGNVFGAIERFQILADRYPNDARLQVRIGQSWASLGDLERSMEHYRKALAQAPDNVDALRSMAILSDALDRPADAVRHYQQMAVLFPTDVSIQAAIRANREGLDEPRLPAPVEEMQKLTLESYNEALLKHSVQLKKRAEQIGLMKGRSAVRFLPQFFVSPSTSQIDSVTRTRAGRDDTTILGFSFGWNVADLVIDPYQINLTGLQADLAAVQSNLLADATATYYQRLNEILNYRNLQRALALDPVNLQIRQQKRSSKFLIINLSERLRIMTGQP